MSSPASAEDLKLRSLRLKIIFGIECTTFFTVNKGYEHTKFKQRGTTATSNIA